MATKKIDKNIPKKPVNKGEKSMMEINPSSKLIWIGAILVLTFIAFYPSLQCLFTKWDDHVYVTESELIKSLSFDNIKKMFSTESTVALNYHPLTMISLAIDYHFAKLNPERYHLVNILFHLINTVLVFFFVYRLSGKKMLVAIIVSLFFGIHPMHVESVTWIAERKDVLYTLFFVGALLTYLSYCETKKNKFLLLTFIFFLFSVFSKAMGVVLPFILLLIDYFKERKIDRKMFLEKIPFLIVSFIIGVFAIKVQAQEAIGSYQAFSLPNRICIGFYGFFTYIWKMFLPMNLSSFHPYPPKGESGMYPLSFYLSSLFGAAILIAAIISFFKSRKEYRYIWFGIGFYFLTVVLVLQFLSVGKTVISERYTYLSYIGLLFVLGTFINNLIEKNSSYKFLIYIFLAAGTLIFSIETFARTKVWKDAETLWSDVLKQYPYPEYYVENAYIARGNFRAAEKNDFEGALADYDILLKKNVTYPEIYYNLGYVYGVKGNVVYRSGDTLQGFDLLNKSNEYFTKSLQLDSLSLKTFKNRGTNYIFMKKYDLAAADFDMAVKIEPDNLEMIEKRAYAYNMSGQWDKSITDYDKLVLVTPDNPNLYLNRGKAKYNNGNYKDAIDDFNKFAQLQPKVGIVYNLLALCYNRLGDRINVLASIEKARQAGLEVSEKEIENFAQSKKVVQ